MSGWLTHFGAPPVRYACVDEVRKGSDGGEFIVQATLAAGHELAYAPGEVGLFDGEDGAPVYMAFASDPAALPTFELLIGSAEVAARFESSVGLRVGFQAPLGRAYPMTRMVGRDIVLLAMGSGIAPIRAAIQSILAKRRLYPRVHLLQGARTEEMLFCAEEALEWEAQGIGVLRTITREDPQTEGVRTGRVQEHLADVIRPGRETWAVVCGSQEMVQETRVVLMALGVPAGRVVTNFEGMG